MSSTLDLLVIGDDSSCADIEAAIAALRTKQDRMPRHFVERRAALGEVIDDLVDRWIVRRADEAES